MAEIDQVERTARRLRYGLAKCVYAAAHDIDPWEVEETDGGYQDVHQLCFDEESDMVEILAKAAGLPDDAEYAHVLEWITARSGGEGDPK